MIQITIQRWGYDSNHDSGFTIRFDSQFRVHDTIRIMVRFKSRFKSRYDSNHNSEFTMWFESRFRVHNLIDSEFTRRFDSRFRVHVVVALWQVLNVGPQQLLCFNWAEMFLQPSVRRLHTVLETQPGGVWLASAKGHYFSLTDELSRLNIVGIKSVVIYILFWS